eukprot:365783-Chlamydomonas_euryale.AAC.6
MTGRAQSFAAQSSGPGRLLVPGRPSVHGRPPVHGRPLAAGRPLVPGRPPVHGRPLAAGRPPVHGRPLAGRPWQAARPWHAAALLLDLEHGLDLPVSTQWRQPAAQDAAKRRVLPTASAAAAAATATALATLGRLARRRRRHALCLPGRRQRFLDALAGEHQVGRRRHLLHLRIEN